MMPVQSRAQTRYLAAVLSPGAVRRPIVAGRGVQTMRQMGQTLSLKPIAMKVTCPPFMYQPVGSSTCVPIQISNLKPLSFGPPPAPSTALATSTTNAVRVASGGMGTTTKVGIGVAVAAVAGFAAWHFAKRKAA